MGSIFTSQTPGSDVTDGSTARQLGIRFQTSASDQIVTAGRYWVPSTGLSATARWQLWRVSDVTKLVDVDLHSLPAPTSSAWMDVTIPASVALAASANYIVCSYSSGTANVDHYVFSGSGSPGSNGNISWDITIYKNDGTANQMPDQTNFPGGLFFADITTATAPHEGTAASAIDLALAATGSAPHQGTAAPSINLALAATGSASHDGTSDPAITLALAATGQRNSAGAGPLAITLTLSASGTNHSGILLRPNTGTVIRPYTGIVTRP